MLQSRVIAIASWRWRFAVGARSDARAADDGVWSVSKSSGEVWIVTSDAAAGLAQAGRGAEAGRHHPHRAQRPRAAGARRGDHPDFAEFGDRPAGRKEGRACDDHRAAGRFDPARSREAQRQAFRGRDALPRRRGQGNAVPRHGECRQHQRRGAPGPGRSRGLQVRPDRAGHARPDRHRLRERQGRPFAQRLGHVQSDRAGQAARVVDRTRAGSEGRPVCAAQRRERAAHSRARSSGAVKLAAASDRHSRPAKPAAARAACGSRPRSAKSG